MLLGRRLLHGVKENENILARTSKEKDNKRTGFRKTEAGD